MYVLMRPEATREQIDRVADEIRKHGFEVWERPGEGQVFLGCVGHVNVDKSHLVESFQAFPGVEHAGLISDPYKLASRQWIGDKQTTVPVGPVAVGGNRLWVCAGPCAVESSEQIEQTAAVVKEHGGMALRGGAFKPRTSPYEFQGLGYPGLLLLSGAGKSSQLPVVTEVMSENLVELVELQADVLQVGARNMQNYALLTKLCRVRKPILLKRGLAATLEELLFAAEYLLAGGEHPANVILCLRGVRTAFGDPRRLVMSDVGDIAVLKRKTHLPVIFDPSHATGRAEFVSSSALQAVAGGADGLLVEVHPDPTQARSDRLQQLTFEQFAQLMREIKPVAEAVGRTL